MLLELRSPVHLPAPLMSTDEKPLWFDCPKCGAQLHIHNSRTDVDANGQPQRVSAYLCFTDGFFTFRNSAGLTEGL